MMTSNQTIPETFEGIGYTKSRDGFPLEAVHVPVPRPGPDQVLIHAADSSLNPLDYKLADLNFLAGRRQLFWDWISLAPFWL